MRGEIGPQGGVAGETRECFRERVHVLGRHYQGSARGAQDLRRLALERREDRPPAREDLEHLRGDEGAEERHRAQRDEDHVGRAVQRGHFLAGHGVPERHVFEGERAGLRLQGFLLRALADEEEVEAGIRPQALRDVQDPREPVADAVGAAVEHQELVAEAQPAAQHEVLGSRLEGLQVDAVRDDVELGPRNPAPRDVGREPACHGDHRACTPIEE